MRLIVEPGDPTSPGAAKLLRASHALMASLFAPEDNHYLSLDALKAPDIAFFVARLGPYVVGTGALRACDGYGEVKSMFTAENARGKGVAAALLRRIEDHARADGLPLLRLETGNALTPALRLYERHGFRPCPPFGSYAANTTSVFMEKPLGEGA